MNNEERRVENQEDNPDRWERIAARLPGKTAEEVKAHYDLLQVTLDRKMSSKSRKKIIKWTNKEHRAFLLGIAVCGKGDWCGISRQYVPEKTPSQVASHAQKYFERQGKEQSKKKRRSIHDVTLETLTAATANEPTNGHPAVQSNGSSNGQPIRQTHRPANGTPTLDIDTSMNRSSVQQPPQLRNPPAPAHSTPINLRLTPGTFIPIYRSDDPRAPALNIPPLASRAPDKPAQSEQEPHSLRGSFHSPVS